MLSDDKNIYDNKLVQEIHEVFIHENTNPETSVTIKLEDDKFLFPDGKINIRSQIITHELNQEGIYTIDEFINCNKKMFYEENRYYICALIDILRYKYLNEKLVNESLFRKKQNDVKEMEQDLKVLGFDRWSNLWDFIQKFSESGMAATIEKFFKIIQCQKKIDENIKLISNTNPKQYIRKNNYQAFITCNGDVDLFDFYINYINSMEMPKEEKIINEKVTLIDVKKQLELLIASRDSLNSQIDDIENKIKVLDKCKYYEK